LDEDEEIEDETVTSKEKSSKMDQLEYE